MEYEKLNDVLSASLIYYNINLIVATNEISVVLEYVKNYYNEEEIKSIYSFDENHFITLINGSFLQIVSPNFLTKLNTTGCYVLKI